MQAHSQYFSAYLLRSGLFTGALHAVRTLPLFSFGLPRPPPPPPPPRTGPEPEVGSHLGRDRRRPPQHRHRGGRPDSGQAIAAAAQRQQQQQQHRQHEHTSSKITSTSGSTSSTSSASHQQRQPPAAPAAPAAPVTPAAHSSSPGDAACTTPLTPRPCGGGRGGPFPSAEGGACGCSEWCRCVPRSAAVLR